jgi:hypothetical protein
MRGVGSREFSGGKNSGSFGSVQARPKTDDKDNGPGARRGPSPFPDFTFTLRIFSLFFMTLVKNDPRRATFEHGNIFRSKHGRFCAKCDASSPKRLILFQINSALRLNYWTLLR